MLNKTVLLLSLFSFSTLTWAAQCPPASAWSHEQGHEWMLSAQAQQEGWQAYSEDAANKSDLTNLTENKDLFVNIYGAGYDVTMCGYSLIKGDMKQTISALSLHHGVDVNQLKPPFYLTTRGHYWCNTTAGQSEVCRWTWRK